MIETAVIAFTTFFATIGPPDVAVVFAALTAKNTSVERRKLATTRPSGYLAGGNADGRRSSAVPYRA